MPIYDYKCNDCGNTFEQIVRNRDEIVACPKCSGNNTQRKISAFAVSNSYSKGDSCEYGGGHHCCGECSCHH